MSGDYDYNGLGQRIEKIVDGVATEFAYGIDGKLLAEVDSTGSVIREYVYLNGQLLAVLDQVGGVTEVAYVHTDHLATPIAVSDESGAEVWRAGYNPFGAATIDAGSSFGFNVRFPGQYFDAENGTHYNYFRTYDPTIGRYVQSDPIGIRGGSNGYAYASENPLTKFDPYGLLSLTTDRSVDPNDLGLTLCSKGKFNYEIYTSDTCIVDCVTAHEAQHVKDFSTLGTTKWLCDGVDYSHIVYDKREESRFEYRAYKAEAACLRKQLQGCDGKCKARREGRLKVVEEMIRFYLLSRS